MRRHDFGYFFHEGVVNLFSHGFMSFAAVCMIVACLLIMGSFTLLAVNLDQLLGKSFLFAALPLKFENSDGCSCRAVAMVE